MKLNKLLIMLLIIAFCFANVCYATNETVPEFYRKSLSDDLPGRKGDFSDIEKEIKDQAQAVLGSLNIDADKALADFSLDNAVKMAISQGTEVRADLDELVSAYTVIYNTASTTRYDEYDSDFLRYVWKIPVAETETHYIFAALMINSANDISVSTGFTSDKDGLNVKYLFDRQLISNTLKESKLNVNYDLMIPLSLPSLYTDIVIFEADKVLYGIPLSARDDLLGTKSGSIYKLDDLNGIISEYVKKQFEGASGGLATGGGGGGGSATDTVAPEKGPDIGKFVLPTVVTVAVACFVYWRITKKRQNRV